MRYFSFCEGLTMTNARFNKLFGGPPRKAESPLTQREMDLARSVQDVTEEAMLRMARHVHRVTKQKNLCMAGGVALNCVGNGRLLREGPFEKIWVQPAAGDAGGALGVALAIWHGYLGNQRNLTVNSGRAIDSLKGSFLGPSYSEDEIRTFLDTRNIPYATLSREKVPREVAALLAREKVVGWFQGRMEFGPRALGARSILGDARSPSMQSVMNLKIKHRESFRPFAPAILREEVANYFEIDSDSPYMLMVAPVREEKRRSMTGEENGLFGIDKLNVPRSVIPAVTHIDYSARIQTVRADENPVFHELLSAFHALTGCPVIVNTSFNVRGEPIVCSPADAYRCFMRTEMDYLVLENFVLDKSEQPSPEEDRDWTSEFALD
jgi:carbamoyltransferase